NGVELFKTSVTGYYDAILMDIRMPVMDGLTAARMIRKSGRPDAGTVPVIAMSANAFEEDVKKSLAAGMNEHLAKPVEPEKMYEILSREITKRKNK
ncbi:MAG: response regulator, partial [Lachnospiraceae bacterium]|nr:response regulator [Lachnospiraceae bacterium]